VHWRATAEQTLLLDNPDSSGTAAARKALEHLADADPAHAELAAHLRAGLDAGVLQLASLVGLAARCHDEPPEREPARQASQALFQHVLPTPIPGREVDFFWRVARSIERVAPAPQPSGRTVAYRTFTSRDQAVAFASANAAELLTITEVAGPSGVETTVWSWTEPG